MPEDDTVEMDFEDEDGTDGAKALEFSRSLKLEYNPDEVEFWFTQIENEMFTCEIKSQWLKRSILVKNLPPKIQADVKALLILKKSDAPALLYKKIKTEILRLHAPREEDTFKKALSRVLVGLPSQLGQTLLTDICKKSVKLENCCCHNAIYTLWCLQLPNQVRSQISNMPFNKDTYVEVFQAADKIFLSTKQTELSAGVAAVTVKPSEGSTTAGATAAPQVAAAKPRRVRRNGGGGSNNATTSTQGGGTRPSRGTRHKSNPPSSCCDNHFRWGASAWFCLSPLTCPWKDKNSARPEKKKED